MTGSERPLSGALALVRHEDWIEAVAIERTLFGSGIVLQGRWQTDAAGMAECVRRCAGTGVERVGLFLPRGVLMLRRVTLPAATQANLADVLEFEIERHFPVPAAQTRWGFLQQGGERQGQIDILLAGGPTERVEALTAPFDENRVPLDVAAPLAPLAMRLLAPSGTEQPDVIIIASGERCEIVLGCQGRMLASRLVDRIGADAYDRLSAVIQELVARHHGDVTERGINRIFWVGQSDIPPELETLLQNDTGAHCLGAGAWLEILAAKSEYRPTEASALAALLALALMEQPCPAIDILHRPPRRKPKRYDLGVAALLAVLLVLGLVGHALRNHAALTAQRDALNTEILSLDDTVKRIMEDEKALDAIQKSLAHRQRLVDSQPRPLRAISELTDILHDDIWVRRLTFDYPKITADGTCTDQSSMYALVEPLTVSNIFNKLEKLPNVQPNPRGKPTFTLTLTLQEQTP